MKTREAEFLGAVFRYLAECIEDGDLNIVREMGLEPADIGVIANLTLTEMRRLNAMRGHCVEIKIERASLNALCDHILTERTRQLLHRQFLEADAPRALMWLLFAIERHDYDLDRKRAGLPPHKPGRCSKPSPAITTRVYAALNAAGHREFTSLAPELWLAIAQESGASLSEIWALHQEDGLSTVPSLPSAPNSAPSASRRLKVAPDVAQLSATQSLTANPVSE